MKPEALRETILSGGSERDGVSQQGIGADGADVSQGAGSARPVSPMSVQIDSYTAMIRGIERVALAARYVIFATMLALFVLGQIPGNVHDVTVIAVVVVFHCLFAHWVLWTHRYGLLVTYFNFFLYLIELSIIVSFSGADESPAFVLYIIFLIGFTAYKREFPIIMLATVACVLAFSIVLLIEWRLVGISVTLGELVFKQLSIVVTGWLAGNLSQRLRQAEEESFSQAQRLAASEATLRAILDHTADPILVFDEQEVVVDANDGACQYFGTAREHVVGQRLRTFLFDDGTLPQKAAAMRRKGQFHGEQLVIGPDGEERAADIVVRSFIRDNKQYFVALMHDITPQKDLQEATRQANLRLERLNRELRHVDGLRTGFLSAVSQKLRSPLSAVLGYIEMLLQEELGDVTDEQRKALQTCRRGTLRAFRIIDDTLALAPGAVHESGPVPEETSHTPSEPGVESADTRTAPGEHGTQS